jgi:hypothetical protein
MIYLDKGRLWLWQCQIFRICAKSANKRQTTVTMNQILTQKWFLLQNIEDSSLNLTFVTVLSITKIFFWREFESRICGAFLPWREFVCRIKRPMSKPRYKILCWRELVCTGVVECQMVVSSVNGWRGHDTLTTVCQRASERPVWRHMRGKSPWVLLTGYCIDGKHLLLIDLKFSKNSGMIMYRCRTFCKNFKFFTETGKYFGLIQ